MSGEPVLTDERDGPSLAMETPGSAGQRLDSLDQRVRVLEEEVAWLRDASAKTEASGVMASASTPPSGVSRVQLAASGAAVAAEEDVGLVGDPADVYSSTAAEPSPQLTVEIADLRSEVERLIRQTRAQGSELALLRVLAAPQTEALQGLEDLHETDLRRWPREFREKLLEASGLIGRLRQRIAELEAE